LIKSNRKGFGAMPELPDVETFRRYLNSTAVHKKIEKVHVKDERILEETSAQSLGKLLHGRQLEETSRHGKFLFVKVGTKGWLILHFGMTGQLKYQKENKDEVRYARFILDFENEYQLIYCCKRMLGKVGFTEDWREYVEKLGLGPDALGENMDFERFSEIIGKSQTKLKSVLMDQSSIAGIGNVYSDEILFQSGIHPGKKASKLDKTSRKKLFKKMHEVLQAAIDFQVDEDRIPEHFLLAHRDTDQRCPRCDGKIRKETISGRSSYFCPKCQK
jgi:formamidopyrimidine-DNA glycosylase